jgi:hypothetical protein
MLKSVKECLDYTVLATDGEIGEVSDFLLDDELKLRYLVIGTGRWLPGKTVMLPLPGSARWIPRSRRWS